MLYFIEHLVISCHFVIVTKGKFQLCLGLLCVNF